MILFLRGEGFSDFTGLCGIISNDFLICTRKILTSEKSESWANKIAFSGGISAYGMNLGINLEGKTETEKKKKKKNTDQIEYQRVPHLTYADFNNCLKSFQRDLKTISETQKIKIVLLIDEAQVMFFLFIFLLYFVFGN